MPSRLSLLVPIVVAGAGVLYFIIWNENHNTAKFRCELCKETETYHKATDEDIVKYYRCPKCSGTRTKL